MVRILPILSSLIISALAYGANDGKLIILTFDDGPRPDVLFGTKGSGGLINLLKSFNVPAHFFMVGKSVNTHPAIVGTVVKEGFLVENHSFGHENLPKLRSAKGDSAVLQSIMRANESIRRATGRFPRFFRPPFEATNKNIKILAEKTGLKFVSIDNPDIDTLDYKDYAQKRSPEILVKRVKDIIAAREKRGIKKHVLLFHELPNSVAALRILIPHFLADGYKFGTLYDFFDHK